jgi:vancomycin resistance protein YoaR
MTDGILPLVVHETPPIILDASAQAGLARRILSAPLTIQSPDSSPGDPGPWTFDPPALASMLDIERVESPEGAKYQVGLNSDNLRTFLEGIAPSFVRYPANARFIFNDETGQLEQISPAVTGRALDIEASLALINQKLAEGEHRVDLDLEYTNPAVTDEATADSLSIREAVSVYTSYFYGSSAARIQNIQTSAARFHGLLVPPNSTFSMAEALGDVSLDNGYAEALIIYGDRTIKGVGGGVCQVSTTLFRTVFFGGFPVVERYAHAYRVGYYEQTPGGGIDSNLAGLDATVFAPVVDFKFTNDTPYWLLMETYVNPDARTITWKFYSTSDGRSVEWDTSGPANAVEPPDPLYEENPELAPGEIKQVDWEAQGADVTVTRTVYRDGQVYFSDDFFTHYLPWQAMYQYGPGTEIPTPEADD